MHYTNSRISIIFFKSIFFFSVATITLSCDGKYNGSFMQDNSGRLYRLEQHHFLKDFYKVIEVDTTIIQLNQNISNYD